MVFKSLIIKLLQKQHRLNWLVGLTTSFCEDIKTYLYHSFPSPFSRPSFALAILKGYGWICQGDDKATYYFSKITDPACVG